MPTTHAERLAVQPHAPRFRGPGRKTRGLILGTAMAALLGSPAAATDVATFLAKVETFKHNKLAAFFSGDVKRLMDEVSASFKQLKAERLRAEASGHHGAYCSPERANLTQDELFASLNAVPVNERPRVQLTDALRGGLARKYPCRR